MKPHKIVNGKTVFLTDEEMALREKEEKNWYEENAKERYKIDRALDPMMPKDCEKIAALWDMAVNGDSSSVDQLRKRIEEVCSKYPG